MAIAFEAEVGVFLATCRTATLATFDSEVGPHAANVQYVHDEAFRLFWVSSPATRHSRNLDADPRAAITVYAHNDRPEQIHGVQMRGIVRPVTDPTRWQAIYERYTAKFAFILESRAMQQAVRSQCFYAFEPTWLRWIDNRRGFGWKLELELPGSARAVR